MVILNLMYNNPSDQASHLYDLLSDICTAPEDNYNHYQWIRPLKLPPGSEAEATFKISVVEKSFLNHTKQRRQNQDIEELAKHWEIILLNLVYVMYQRSWLVVPMNPDFYARDNYWTKRLGVSFLPMKTVIDCLRDHDFVECEEGNPNRDGEFSTRISPRPSLMWFLWRYFLDIEQPIEPPYLIVKMPNYGWKEIRNLPRNHCETQELNQINEFLKDQKWACKAPMQLKFENPAFEGGRLSTPFQDLPGRRIKLRINTLINENPVGEVNFSANQLRLNLAVNGGIPAGDTPYENIADAAGISGTEKKAREKAKRFIILAMRSSDKEETRSICLATGIDNDLFDALCFTTQKLYPKLDLFSGWGIHAQKLEGKILKKMILEGIKKDVVCLPVHDAVVVQQEHLKWAEDAMLECWDRQMETSGFARVKVDLPNEGK